VDEKTMSEIVGSPRMWAAVYGVLGPHRSALVAALALIAVRMVVEDWRNCGRAGGDIAGSRGPVR
jgi:hypothetical protein